MIEAKEPKPGIYQHFKGNLYFVAGVAQHTEDQTEKYVIYYPLYASQTKMWVRPLSSWNESVEKPEYSGPRFVFIEDNGSSDLLVGKEHVRILPDFCEETRTITNYYLKDGVVYVDYTVVKEGAVSMRDVGSCPLTVFRMMLSS